MSRNSAAASEATAFDLHEIAMGERRRYFDTNLKKTIVSVVQGDYYISSNPEEIIATILGSCIAVCMRDPVVGCGGMNHFLLPHNKLDSDDLPSLELRYGCFSIERLINAIVSRGGRRDRLEVKIFGGANVVSGANVGHHNVDFVERYFEKEALPVVAMHTRGTLPRRLRYDPVTGRAQLRETRTTAMSTVLAMESRLRTTFAATQASSVEIW